MLTYTEATSQCRYIWATWSDQGTTDSAVASLVANGYTINMTMKANYQFAFTPKIYNYSYFKNFSDAPPNDIVPRTTWIAGSGGKTTMCFSQTVVNPVLLLSSIGNATNHVILNLSLPYRVLYNGGGVTFVNSTTIKGYEGNCIIEFPGSFDCISIFSSTPEVYTNLTWGIRNPLFAKFDYSIDCVKQQVIFTSTATINSPGKIVKHFWDFGDGDSSLQTNPIHYYKNSGVYKVVQHVTSDYGCTDTISQYIVFEKSPPVDNPQTICDGGIYTIGTHTYTISGTYSDTFKAMSGCDSVVITRLQIIPKFSQQVNVNLCYGMEYLLPSGKKVKQPGVYNDTLKSITGCDSIIITQITPSPPLKDSSGVTHTRCYGEKNGSIVLKAYGGISPYQYYLSDSLQNYTGQFKQLPAANYHYLIQDKNGCYVKGNISINQPAKINLGLNIHDISVDYNSIVNLQVNCNYHDVSFLWTPSYHIDCDTCKSINILADSNLTYQIQAQVNINNHICYAQDSVQIRLIPIVYIPNAFTPNDDKLNDNFHLSGSYLDNLEDFEIYIYDRWGEVVFHSNDPYFVWDGSYKKRDRIDVFIYQMNYRLGKQKEILYKKGSVTCIW